MVSSVFETYEVAYQTYHDRHFPKIHSRRWTFRFDHIYQSKVFPEQSYCQRCCLQDYQVELADFVVFIHFQYKFTYFSLKFTYFVTLKICLEPDKCFQLASTQVCHFETDFPTI